MIAYLKKEKVLCIALLLGMVSSFFVHPDKKYLGYIDVRVLALLFCLMLLVKGFQGAGLLDLMIVKMFGHVNSSRSMSRILILLCFFLSMVMTNDVALITFVPFAILALKRCGQEKLIIRVVVLQTIAANLGSMLTPIGNPQNLYLFSVSNMPTGEFFKTMLPLAVVSILFLTAASWILPDEEVQLPAEQEAGVLPKREIGIYSVLFAINLLVVFRVISWVPAIIITVLTVLFIHKSRLLTQVDYALLFIFIGFFVFVGNMGRIPAVSTMIAQILRGKEILVSAVFSQFLSNVPAALLLSGFTRNFDALLVGTNIGGLGTLIASMASLISYKQYAVSANAKKGKYLLTFTLYNLAGFFLLLSFSEWYYH